jgi:hypothetical protein
MLHRARIVLSFLLLCLTALPLLAQVDKASVDAVALDQSKAPLPGVTVTLARPETGYQAVAVTDSSGTAKFTALTPGNYTIAFALEGFAPVSQNNIQLLVGQTAKLSVVMQAAASETLTISAAAPVVDVHKTDSSTNIVPEQIEQLPVADRQFERLAFIAPGVERERGSFRFINGGPVIGAGGNASQSTILVNGVDLTDQVNGLARARFSQDAVREFRVIANRFDTEIGGSAGGALSIVTKSGTNDLHGSAFGFFRDSAIGSSLDDYSRHQIGLTGGGPLQRDRTFFFGSIEQINEHNVVFVGGNRATGRPVPHPFDQSLVFGSIDMNMSAQMTGGFKAVYEKYTEDNFRVGGVADESYGQTLERKNWNGTFEHNWAVSSVASNEARLQFGKRRFFEPTNSDALSEWFSSGNTLQTGSNILGDLLGDGSTWELRDTYHHGLTFGRSSHDLKAGFSYQRVHERFRLDTYEHGLLIWLSPDRTLPLAYAYGVGSSDVDTDTNIYGGFIEDSWRPGANLTVNLGLRYDLDTNGNNAGFTHPLVPTPRERDSNNFQPRVSFSYDLRGNGSQVLRGGAGKFVGRMLLVPALTELQANGITGRVTYTRLNGTLFGLPSLALDPARPLTTGIQTKPAITLLSPTYKAPEAKQASLGYTIKVPSSRLFFDTEAIYVKGENEVVIRDVNWSGNATHVRPNTTYDQINVYTNEGHSQYKALVFAVNGNVRQNDLITASVTFARKKNVSDDFSPDFPTGYPNDPANIESEYGPARGTEKYRVVLSGIFHAPFRVNIAPIIEYGSGQPWTHRLGYDYNGDGKNSDRPAGVGRNTMQGPRYRNVSLRLTKDIAAGGFGSVQAIAEAFNVFDFTNYDVQSVFGGEFLSGPTITNPNAKYVPNVDPVTGKSRFGTFAAQLPSREIQLGIRWVY